MSGSVDSSMIQENIEEYVNDENKIVTCRWLSLTLNIHINVAKQALFSFVTSARNKGGNDDVNVTYFVAGLGQSKAGDPMHKCVVVPESHLDIVKSELNPVTSCHVYSVQKVKLKDTTALYQTDYDIIKENLTVSPSLSNICCPWAVLRDTTRPAKTSKPVEPEISRPAVKTSKDSNTTSVKSNGSSNSSSASNTTTKKKTEAKGSIASMFASAGKKGDGQKVGGDGQKTAVSDKTQSNKQKPKAAEKKGGMMAFVSAQPKDTSEKIEIPKATEKVKSEERKVKESKEKIKEKPSRKTKQQQNSGDKQPIKKSRRRIKTDLFDSSDDDNSEEERGLSEEEEECAPVLDDEESQEMNVDTEDKEEEEETPAEPELKKEEEKTSPPPSDGSRKRKRTRKLVPKQYVDEDGFMVTEKVWESDSTDASDTEAAKKVVEKAKPEPSKSLQSKPSAAGQKTEAKGKKAVKKSVASPQKGKQQTSLMSFFTKK